MMTENAKKLIEDWEEQVNKEKDLRRKQRNKRKAMRRALRAKK